MPVQPVLEQSTFRSIRFGLVPINLRDTRIMVLVQNNRSPVKYRLLDRQPSRTILPYLSDTPSLAGTIQLRGKKKQTEFYSRLWSAGFSHCARIHRTVPVIQARRRSSLSSGERCSLYCKCFFHKSYSPAAAGGAVSSLATKEP